MNEFDISVSAELSAEEERINDSLWDSQDRDYFGDTLVSRWGSEKDTKVYVVARKKGSVAGIGIMKIFNGVGRIDYIITDPTMRGLGVGRQVFEELLSEARMRDLFYVWLETKEEWTAAVKLYESCGFEITEKIPVYYFGVPWVRMGKKLGS